MEICQIITVLLIYVCKCIFSAPVNDTAAVAPCSFQPAAIAIAVCVSVVCCIIIFVVIVYFCRKRIADHYKPQVINIDSGPLNVSTTPTQMTTAATTVMVENLKINDTKTQRGSSYAEIPLFFDNWKSDLKNANLKSIEYNSNDNKQLGFDVEVQHGKVFVTNVQSNKIHNLGMMPGDEVVGFTVYFESQSTTYAEQLLSFASTFPLCIYLKSAHKDDDAEVVQDLHLRHIKIEEEAVKKSSDFKADIDSSMMVLHAESECKNENVVTSSSEMMKYDIPLDSDHLQGNIANHEHIVSMTICPELHQTLEDYDSLTDHEDNVESTNAPSLNHVLTMKENVVPPEELDKIVNSKSDLNIEKRPPNMIQKPEDNVEDIKVRLINALPIIEDTSIRDEARIKYSRQIVQRVLQNATNYISAIDKMNNAASKIKLPPKNSSALMDIDEEIIPVESHHLNDIFNNDEVDNVILLNQEADLNRLNFSNFISLISTASQFDPIEHLIFKAVLHNIEVDETSSRESSTNLGDEKAAFDLFESESVASNSISDEGHTIHSLFQNDKAAQSSGYLSFNEGEFFSNSHFHRESAPNVLLNNHREQELLNATYMDEFGDESENYEDDSQQSSHSSHNSATKNETLESEGDNDSISSKNGRTTNDGLKKEQEEHITKSIAGKIHIQRESDDTPGRKAQLTFKDKRKRMKFSPSIEDKVSTSNHSYASTPLSIGEEEIVPFQVDQQNLKESLNSTHSLAHLDKEIALNNVEIATLLLMDSFEKQRLHQQHDMRFTTLEQQRDDDATPVNEEPIYAAAFDDDLKKNMDHDDLLDVMHQSNVANQFNEQTSPLDEDLLHEIYRSAREFHEEDNDSDLFEYQIGVGSSAEDNSETGSLREMIANVDQLSEEHFESLIKRLEDDSD